MNGTDFDMYADVQVLYAYWALLASCYGSNHPETIAARAAYVRAYEVAA